MEQNNTHVIDGATLIRMEGVGESLQNVADLLEVLRSAYLAKDGYPPVEITGNALSAVRALVETAGREIDDIVDGIYKTSRERKAE